MERTEANPLFSWLHLTDLHRGMAPQAQLWPNVAADFERDVRELYQVCGPWDVVFFTGDLAYSGREYPEVNDVLQSLWRILKDLGCDPALLAVPGNHDVVRPSDDFKLEVDALREWHRRPLEQPTFWRSSTDRKRRVANQAFASYSNWFEGHPFPRIKRLDPGDLPGDFSATIEKQDHSLGIVGLNTSFVQLESGDYRKRIALDVNQFHAACGGNGPRWTDNHDVCMLLTHHPPSWFGPRSMETYRGEIAIPGRFVLHMFGHQHDPEYTTVAEGAAEARRFWQGSSLFGLEHWSKSNQQVKRLHGYSAGRLYVNDGVACLRFWPRMSLMTLAGNLRLVPDHRWILERDGGTPPDCFRIPRRHQFRGLGERDQSNDLGGHETLISQPAPQNEQVASYVREIEARRSYLLATFQECVSRSRSVDLLDVWKRGELWRPASPVISRPISDRDCTINVAA